MKLPDSLYQETVRTIAEYMSCTSVELSLHKPKCNFLTRLKYDPVDPLVDAVKGSGYRSGQQLSYSTAIKQHYSPNFETLRKCLVDAGFSLGNSVRDCETIVVVFD